MIKFFPTTKQLIFVKFFLSHVVQVLANNLLTQSPYTNNFFAKL